MKLITNYIKPKVKIAQSILTKLRRKREYNQYFSTPLLALIASSWWLEMEKMEL